MSIFYQYLVNSSPIKKRTCVLREPANSWQITRELTNKDKQLTIFLGDWQKRTDFYRIGKQKHNINTCEPHFFFVSISLICVIVYQYPRYLIFVNSLDICQLFVKSQEICQFVWKLDQRLNKFLGHWQELDNFFQWRIGLNDWHNIFSNLKMKTSIVDSNNDKSTILEPPGRDTEDLIAPG